MRVFRNPDVMWREESDATAEALSLLENGDDAEEVGTAILFSDGVMVSLNVLGTEVWKLCDGCTLEEIVAELLAEFEVEREILERDVVAFLAELAEKGFIHYA